MTDWGNKYYFRSDPISVDPICPQPRHAWTGANELLFSLSGDGGVLFGGELPAIGLDAELGSGRSHPCATFGSPSLGAPQPLPDGRQDMRYGIVAVGQFIS